MADDDELMSTAPEPMRRADAIQRAVQGWQLRVMGRTWQQIADEVGFASPQGAHRAVMRYAGTVPDPDPAALRKLWRARGEHLYSLAVRDAEAGRPGALRAGVAIADRAAKLDGLDAPTRVQVEASVAELDAMVRELLAVRGIELGEEADVLAEIVDG